LKLLIEQSLNCSETEIKITCGLMDDRLKKLIEQIRLYSFSITTKKDGTTISIPLEEIYYFDSTDNKTFLYMDDQVYPCSKKLYELEVALSDTPFTRISKNCILNTSMVQSVRTQFSGTTGSHFVRMGKVLVSKHYLAEFRAKFE